MSNALTPTERFDLVLKDSADFEVDKDGELCIEIPHGFEVARTWLTREEAKQLLDLLTRWLR